MRHTLVDDSSSSSCTTRSEAGHLTLPFALIPLEGPASEGGASEGGLLAPGLLAPPPGLLAPGLLASASGRHLGWRGGVSMTRGEAVSEGAEFARDLLGGEASSLYAAESSLEALRLGLRMCPHCRLRPCASTVVLSERCRNAVGTL